MLEVSGDKMLVITEKATKAMKFANDNRNGSNRWGNTTSLIRAWLNTDTSGNFQYDSFTAAEKALALDTIHTAGGTHDGSADVTTDKFFVLSVEEAGNTLYFADKNARKCFNTSYSIATGASSVLSAQCYWWLRSPGDYSLNVAYVDYTGGVRDNGIYCYYADYVVRPAFYLNLSSIILTSAAAGGKSATAGPTLATFTPNYANAKLTIADSTKALSVSPSSAVACDPGVTGTVSYSGATTGANMYLSAIIKRAGEVTHYAKLKSLTNASDAAGNATITLPAAYDAAQDKLYVFAEQANGDNYTDYASTPIEITGLNAAPVTGVTMNKAATALLVGGTETLTATVNPSDATNKAVTWTSSAPDVASVDQTGKVTGVAAGSAVITATTADGGHTATCAVTVSAVVVPVTGVTMDKTSADIKVANTLQLTALVAPTNATNQNVTWKSSDEKIAAVNSAGLVTAVAKGSATITATTADGGKTATCAVTVTADTPQPMPSGGGGGCNAVAGALALIALVPFALRRKKM